MRFIKAVVPLKDYRLFLELESGSTVTVDLSVKLDTLRYGDLADPLLFQTAKTDGDFVIFGDGQVRLTARELSDVALIG